MHKGFRKALFGFNTDDVLSYIAASDKVAKQKIDKLNAEIESLKAENSKLSAENEVLNVKASEYENKKEQIKLMSDNIARIYVTAKATSKILIDNANESRMLIEEANRERIEALDDTQLSMEQVKSKLIEAADTYSKEITALCNNLEHIKSRIDSNELESKNANEEFEELITAKI